MARKIFSDFHKASTEKTVLVIALNGSNMPVMNRRQCLRGLINKAKWRLLAEEKLKILIKLSRYLETDNWLEGMSFTYGDSETDKTAESSFRCRQTVCDSFQIAVVLKGKSVVKTIPVWTGKCQQSFSGKNLRISLLVDHLLSWVFTKPVGPPPAKVNRGEHVKKWFSVAEGWLKIMEEAEAENDLTQFIPLCFQSLNKKTLQW